MDATCCCIQTPCPRCGYCPCCGRSWNPWPYFHPAPYPIPYQQPIWIGTGGYVPTTTTVADGVFQPVSKIAVKFSG
jgi:hypothetical protein